MKILHITASLQGGAGIAANRLHEALMQESVESNILTLDKGTVASDSIFEWKEAYKSRLPRKIQNYFVSVGIGLTNEQKNYLSTRNLKGTFEIFTSPRTDYDLRRSELVQNCDVIHLHWVSNFLHYNTFFENIDKPVVWTLHDSNPLMGGFHLDSDYHTNAGFQKLEKRYLQIKQNAIKKANNVSVIAPSQWLLERSKKSSIFCGRYHRQIFNCVPTKKYYPINKELARDVLGFGRKELFILFISNSFTFNKGLDIIESIVSDPLLKKIRFISVGNGSIHSANIQHFGKIDNHHLQNLLYACCDAVLIASRDENMPNVLLEAMACGKPVLSFDVGGMSEVIKDNFNGLKACMVSAEELKNTVLEFAEKKDQFNARAIRTFAVENFSYDVIAAKYRDVYEKCLRE